MRKKLAVVGILLAVLAAGLWWQRTPLLSWYYLRGLADARDADRSVWIGRVVSLDVAAVPGLVDLLHRDDPQTCANAEAALSALSKSWGPQDARTAAVADELAAAFSGLSAPGK